MQFIFQWIYLYFFCPIRESNCFQRKLIQSQNQYCIFQIGQKCQFYNKRFSPIQLLQKYKSNYMEKTQFFQQKSSTQKQITFTNSKTKNNNFQFLDALKCKGGNKADHICYSKICQKSALMCTQKKCICSCQHQMCIRLFLLDFIKKIQKKTIDISPIIEQSAKIIDSFIDKVIDEASKLKQSFQNISLTKYQQYFLEKQEKIIFTKLKKNDVKDIKGQDIYKVTNSLFQNQQKNFFSIEKQIQNLKIIWKKLQMKLVDQLNKISEELNNGSFFITLVDNLFRNSSIVRTTQESKIIKQFFEKQILNCQLLYKASENQFTLKNYYQKCTQIPNTILLVQTQYGKKIGGFTPIQWKKSNSLVFVQDKSKTSFIFSLSEKQKLRPFKQKIFIKYDSNMGPIFGNYDQRDISICQNAKKQSTITFNYGFQSNKFKQKNQSNLKLYNGSTKDNVLLKQWQVWKVNFVQ